MPALSGVQSPLVGAISIVVREWVRVAVRVAATVALLLGLPHSLACAAFPLLSLAVGLESVDSPLIFSYGQDHGFLICPVVFSISRSRASRTCLLRFFPSSHAPWSCRMVTGMWTMGLSPAGLRPPLRPRGFLGVVIFYPNPHSHQGASFLVLSYKSTCALFNNSSFRGISTPFSHRPPKMRLNRSPASFPQSRIA